MSATAVEAAGVGGGDRCRALWFGTRASTVRSAVRRTTFPVIGARMKKGSGLSETRSGLPVGAPATSLRGWCFRFGWGARRAAAGPGGPFRQVASWGPPRPALGAGADGTEVPA